MDGVLWHGEKPMPGLLDFFDTLQRMEIGFVLATNNATKTAEQYSQKLAKFGLQIPASLILTSAEATAGYLSQRHEPGSAVYIVGGNGLHQEMANNGFHIISPEEVAAGESAALVVVGLNPTVTYDELAMAALLVLGLYRFWQRRNTAPVVPVKVARGAALRASQEG